MFVKLEPAQGMVSTKAMRRMFKFMLHEVLASAVINLDEGMSAVRRAEQLHGVAVSAGAWVIDNTRRKKSLT